MTTDVAFALRHVISGKQVVNSKVRQYVGIN